MTFHRFVAIGDSFTEGVGDADPSRPHGIRGWADRMAEVLATKTDDFGYANLAIRGRKTQAIIDEQLDVALALNPDLISIQCGGNDLLRPKVDLDTAVALVDEAAGKAVASGATVMLFTHGDGGSKGFFGLLRGRIAIYNELLREVVERHGAVLVDNWRLSEGKDLRYWDEDRLHLAPAGHQAIAIQALDTLGIEHSLQPLPVRPQPQLTPWGRRRADWRWGITYAVPWMMRRMRGISTGDGMTPRYPELGPI